MVWLKYIPFFSITLVMITYGVLGWNISSASPGWSQQLLEQSQNWSLGLEQNAIIIAIHALVIVVIVLTSLALTAPITLVTYFVGGWVHSSLQSIATMLVWSFIFVITLRWFNYFVDFLVILCSAMLGRIELRYAGLNQIQSILILMTLCISSFLGGVFSYFHFNAQI